MIFKKLLSLVTLNFFSKKPRKYKFNYLSLYIYIVLRRTRSPLSPEIWRHCVLSGGIHAALCLDTRAMKMNVFNLNKYLISSSPQPFALTVTLCAPAPRMASYNYLKIKLASRCIPHAAG